MPFVYLTESGFVVNTRTTIAMTASADLEVKRAVDPKQKELKRYH